MLGTPVPRNDTHHRRRQTWRAENCLCTPGLQFSTAHRVCWVLSSFCKALPSINMNSGVFVLISGVRVNFLLFIFFFLFFLFFSSFCFFFILTYLHIKTPLHWPPTKSHPQFTIVSSDSKISYQINHSIN